MRTRLLEVFCQIIESMPPKAILQAVEDFCRKLGKDMFSKPAMLDQDVISILIFNRFLTSTARHIALTPTILPTPHLAFLRQTVQKLVEAKELPADSLEWFDRELFSPPR